MGYTGLHAFWARHENNRSAERILIIEFRVFAMSLSPRLFFLFIVISLLSAVTIPVTSPASSEETLDDLISKIQNLYDRVEDFKVSFIHEVPVRITGKTLVEKGIFSYKKPKRMRWDYTEPPGKAIVVNPDLMWFYMPEDNKVFVQKTETALQSQLAVKFLAGLGNLRQDFDIAFAAPSCRDTEGNYLISLTPKDKAGGVQDIILTIDEDEYYVTGYSLTDMYGNKNTYIFRDISLNNHLPDSLFHYDPPAGAEIERLP